MIASVPQPPVMDMPETAQALFTIWLGLPLAATIGIGIHRLVRKGDPLLLLCVAGGAIACLFEAIVNVLGTMIYAEEGIWTAYTAFDREIPLLIPLAYAWFVGGQAYFTYTRMQKGTDFRGLLNLWLIFCAIDVVIETPGLLADVYEYYGNQPFDLWGFPLWYAWANSLMPIVAAALIFHIRPRLGAGARQLAIVPLLPMADGIAYAAISAPLWATLNTGLGYWATYLAGFAVLGLAIYVLWIVSLVVAPASAERVGARNGARAGGRPAVPAAAGS